MRYITLLAAFMFTTLTFAHEKDSQEKKEMYEAIQLQLENDLITTEQAQKLWLAYTRCCQDT